MYTYDVLIFLWCQFRYPHQNMLVSYNLCLVSAINWVHGDSKFILYFRFEESAVYLLSEAIFLKHRKSLFHPPKTCEGNRNKPFCIHPFSLPWDSIFFAGVSKLGHWLPKSRKRVGTRWLLLPRTMAQGWGWVRRTMGGGGTVAKSCCGVASRKSQFSPPKCRMSSRWRASTDPRFFSGNASFSNFCEKNFFARKSSNLSLSSCHVTLLLTLL